MKPFKLALLLVLILISILIGCRQNQEEQLSFSDQDKAAVLSNLGYMKVDPIDDPDNFFSPFTEDIYWIYDTLKPWDGMEALRKFNWCHTLSANATADYIEGNGTLAYARGNYTLSLNCQGDTIHADGVFLSVHQKQPDGSWKIKSMLQK